MKPRRGRSGGQRELLEGRVIDAGALEAIVDTRAGPVRVRGVVPDDIVSIEIVHVGRNAAWGRLIAILDPSPERVAHRCPLIESCGGCPWQAWAPEAQRREKRRRLARLLEPLTDVRVRPVLAADEEYGYRNKHLVAAGGRPGELRFGLFAPRSHDLVPADACPVQSDAGRAALEGIGRVLDGFSLPPVSGPRGGVLRHLLIRVAPGTGQIGVTLAVRPWPLPRGLEIGQALLTVPGIVSVWANHSPEPDSTALGTKSAPLAGHHRIEARIGETRYLLTPTAFFQTNTPALPLLLDSVGRALPQRMRHLVDLYAGVGLFALAFAGRAQHVTAIESHPRAVKDLAAAARLSGIGNLTVREADAAIVRVRGPQPDALILDPTRGGLPAPLVRRICEQMRPERIVYVSCSPQALAQDLERLAAGGYRAVDVQPVDLFPHTPRLETVVTIEQPAEGDLNRSSGSRSRPW